MELQTLGVPDNGHQVGRAQSQRWQDPSATIFRELSLTRPSKKTRGPATQVLNKQGSRSKQPLFDSSPATSRHSGQTAASSTVIIHQPSHSSSKMTCLNSCCECLGRIPYGSLIATLITGAGVAVACVCTSIGLPHLLLMIKSFKITIRDGVEEAFMTAVISIGAVMATLAIVLLIIGFLATGATRRQVYTGFRSRITGRIAAGFFIILTYFLTIVWFLACCLLLLLTAFFIISVTNCEIYEKSGQWEGNCFNVTTILKGIPAEIELNTISTRLCGEEFKKYCEEAKRGHLCFYAANGGVGLIVLGLIHFLMCLSANYAHIKDGLKLREYEEAKYSIDARDYAAF